MSALSGAANTWAFEWVLSKDFPLTRDTEGHPILKWGDSCFLMSTDVALIRPILMHTPVSNPTIGSVSFGATRTINFRHYFDKKLKTSIDLTSGSFLLMKAETQHYWQHSIAKKTSHRTSNKFNLQDHPQWILINRSCGKIQHTFCELGFKIISSSRHSGQTDC